MDALGQLDALLAVLTCLEKFQVKVRQGQACTGYLTMRAYYRTEVGSERWAWFNPIRTARSASG
jgi:hypothetical protein